MKFTPEVLAALATLRTHADNDFERHRIDVLERDLTVPPTVVPVDENHQLFNGVVYHKDKSGHFVTSQGIHRDVWRYYRDEIPQGYDVHHSDENPANNTVDNLSCLSSSDHQSLHMQSGQRLKKRKATMTCLQCGREYVGYYSGNNRFCSKRCSKLFHAVEYTCETCGKIFRSAEKDARFCSKKCAGATKRRAAKTCLHCGTSFIPKRHNSQKYCSWRCYLAHKGKKARPTYQEERICVICGKSFSCYKYDRSQTCSPTCGSKLAWQNRKKK